MGTLHPTDLANDAKEILPGLWLSGENMRCSWIKHYADKRGVRLRTRTSCGLSTSALDFAIYRKLLTQTLSAVPRSGCILELGAGDGRITRELLSLGFEHIIVDP